MKKSYSQPESQVILLDATHIYTTISGISDITGRPLEIDFSSFGI